MTRPAAAHVMELMDFLGQQRGPLPAATIARQLNLPRSSVYDLLKEMEARGYAVHDRERRRWGLGVRAFELASGYQRQQPLVLFGTPILRRLVEATGVAGHLAVLHGTDVIYLVEERTRKGPWLVTDVGVRLPAHLTATGRAILASLPPAQLRALYSSTSAPLALRTSQGPETFASLREILRETRRRGFAVEDNEVTAGMASLAVSVSDTSGWPIAAIALTGEKATIDQYVASWSALLHEAAQQLGQR